MANGYCLSFLVFVFFAEPVVSALIFSDAPYLSLQAKEKYKVEKSQIDFYSSHSTNIHNPLLRFFYNLPAAFLQNLLLRKSAEFE